MKLYKYVRMAAAMAILKNWTIGFSKAKHFNDPFDHPVAIPTPAASKAEGLFAAIGAQGKSFIWSENSAILSLTRTPTNPLMWAHYADAHRGVVLEIDAAAAGLTDEKSNLIPAHLGSVIYVRRFNSGPYYSGFAVPVTTGETFHLVLEHYEKWQRLFLTKPLDWAYEEEVRVVKCIRGVEGQEHQCQSGLFSVVAHHGRELHAFHLPEGAITGVILGLRSKPAEADALRALRPDLAFRRAKMDSEAYAIRIGQAAP